MQTSSLSTCCTANTICESRLAAIGRAAFIQVHHEFAHAIMVCAAIVDARQLERSDRLHDLPDGLDWTGRLNQDGPSIAGQPIDGTLRICHTIWAERPECFATPRAHQKPGQGITQHGTPGSSFLKYARGDSRTHPRRPRRPRRAAPR